LSTGLLVAIIVVGALAFAGAIIAAVLVAVSRQRKRIAAELEAEGIVLDSGRTGVRVSFSGFRGPRFAAGRSARGGPGRVVLTPRRLRILALPHAKYGVGSLDGAALARCRIGVDDRGRLHLRGEDLPGTTGRFELFVRVVEPERWIAALVAAGARPGPG
jgi:hypothetical protein